MNFLVCSGAHRYATPNNRGVPWVASFRPVALCPPPTQLTPLSMPPSLPSFVTQRCWKLSDEKKLRG
jgi:hypothetical protein